MKIPFFLDSGAFSAYTQNKEIDLGAYIEFIKQHEALIDAYAVLDVIGDPIASYENYCRMEDAGLTPVGCFHYGEDPKWIEKYLKSDYIALGGMASGSSGVALSTAKRQAWLDEVFATHICNTPDRKPRVKVHGFGMTALPLVRRYPWYSVDSTTWLMIAARGSVLVPRYSNGSWDYLANPWSISMSTKSPDKSKEAMSGMHIERLPAKVKAVVLSYFEKHGYVVGESRLETNDKDKIVDVPVVEGLCNNYHQRMELNMEFFIQFAKTQPEWPWALPAHIEAKQKRRLF